jgi:hypothetical protein
MRPRPRTFPITLVAAVLAIALAGACGDPFGLPRPNIPNQVDTVTLYALSGTPVTTPSGYRFFNSSNPAVSLPQPVRTDQSSDFDFVFDIDTAGRALLMPTAVLALGRLSGAQTTTTPFDSIKIAPDRNYNLDSALVVNVGTVAIVHSRPATCSFGISTVYYGKLRVVDVDMTLRRIEFEILVDTNCGYRGLEPGLPSR